ncbi:hypothetical protein S40293_11422 [Stachybotrys chartarum IBT 40293]|nr:hypothetical protein S40293_11422 [Stachybotrys chartarum IBT 40293]
MLPTALMWVEERRLFRLESLDSSRDLQKPPVFRAVFYVLFPDCDLSFLVESAGRSPSLVAELPSSAAFCPFPPLVASSSPKRELFAPPPAAVVGPFSFPSTKLPLSFEYLCFVQSLVLILKKFNLSLKAFESTLRLSAVAVSSTRRFVNHFVNKSA